MDKPAAKTAAQKMCELVGKKYLLFTPRGNASIKMALEILKLQGKYKKVLMQDQGGWLTYSQFIEKLKFEKVELKTDYGLIDVQDLEKHKGAILLINSMPGYATLEDMEYVYEIAKKNSIVVINDASGSIGNDEAKYGDIIIGSFGDAKPIEVGEGGFIATDDEHLFKEFCELNMHKPDDRFLELLDRKLDTLDERLFFFDIARQQVMEDLAIHDIIQPDGKGINVIVKFNNEEEKQEIEAYCREQELEVTLCPRYIRVNAPAISIEIKRLKQPESVDEEEHNTPTDDNVNEENLDDDEYINEGNEGE